MKNLISLLFVFSAITSFAQKGKYSLEDFFSYNPVLDSRVDEIMEGMSEEEIAGQLIVAAAGRLGKSNEHIEKLVREKKVGGILLLNGEKEEFKAMVHKLDSISSTVNGLKLSYSADAEPSLIKYKIKNSTPVKNANLHKTRAEVESTTQTICGDLKYIGITHNYAPVIDISTNNAAIGNRSFGDNQDSVITWSNEFVRVSQENNIVATAKHFPGHGQVVGDTHKKLVYIDGEMTEVDNYRPLINAGVISIMVAHIAVKNNEQYNSDLPATLNKKIVTDLLKNELGFKGVIITDAMGMGGVKAIPNSGVKALKAGIDVLLMPQDEFSDHAAIVSEMKNDPAFAAQVKNSARKIIKLKICQGLLQ